METYQQVHISKNLPKLLDSTIYGPLFAGHLFADGLLTREEIDILDKLGNRYDQASKLYSLLQTRRNSYNLLKQALKETSQTGTLAILNEVNQHNATTPFKNYGAITYFRKLVIGCGSYNTKVYKGNFENREVAVKKINIEDVDLDKALQEVEFLTKLDWHVNVIRYFKAEVTDDFVLIALELCDTDLYDWVTKSKIVEINATDIIRQATEGVEHLHSNQIVHRDLKPDNILLARPAVGRVRVKIADFGMSKLIQDGFSKLYKHTTGVGTEGWLAPEVADGVVMQNVLELEHIMSFTSDVFSLGCIYYFILTEGNHPFGDNQFRRQANILDGKVTLSEDKITAIETGVSEYIVLIRKMITHELTGRPPASEVLLWVKDIENGVAMEEYARYFGDKLEKTEISSNDANLYWKLEDAIHSMNIEAVHALVTQGALTSNSSANYMSETPLHQAALSDDKDFAVSTIKLLIDNGAEVYTKDEDSYTFLHRLVDDKSTLNTQQFHDISEFLVSRNLADLFNIPENVELQSRYGRFYEVYNLSTPFQMAVKNLEIELGTLTLLQENGVDLNAVNSRLNSVLYYAVLGRRSVQFISHMVELGADPKHCNKYNDNLLHYAAIFGDVDHIQFFLDLGLDVNSVAISGFTALNLLVGFGGGNVLEKARFLIERGADAKIKNNHGTAPMDFATQAGDLDDQDELVALLGKYS